MTTRRLFSLLSWCFVGWSAVPLPACAAASTSDAVRPLAAHSHNDYEQVHPLTTALDLGFMSIEADVHLIGGELYVAHEPPAAADPARTLEHLYLAPIAAHLRGQGGVAFPGTATPLFLMIDIKGPADPTYTRLVELLTPYADLLTPPPAPAKNGGKPARNAALVVVLSGNRPLYRLLRDPAPLAVLDGRPDELASGIPASLSPIVSAPYYRFFAGRGDGAPTPSELAWLTAFTRTAHAEGKRTRLWGAPDTESMWTLLRSCGVDLLNADDLPRLARFLTAEGSETGQR